MTTDFSAFRMASSSPSTPSSGAEIAAISPEDFDELEDILDDIRSRYDETPQWEFCEGFMAGLLCMRSPVPLAAAFAVLLEWTPESEKSPLSALSPRDAAPPVFASIAQQERFTALWIQRCSEVEASLQADVQTLQDPGCYMPPLMDMRGYLASLSAAEKAAFDGAFKSEFQEELDCESLASFGQTWAIGFMFAVENWPEQWEAPKKDKAAAALLDSALQAIIDITDDDHGLPEISPHEDVESKEASLPTASIARMEAIGAAVWAVYDLYALWKSIGPRIETVRHSAALPGRNDPCFCGSGKKYKKCHGSAA